MQCCSLAGVHYADQDRYVGYSDGTNFYISYMFRNSLPWVGSIPLSAYCLLFLSNVSLHGSAFGCGWILLFCIQLRNRLSSDF